MGFGQELAQRLAKDWTPRFSVGERAELTGIVRSAFVDTQACALAGRDDAATQAVRAWLAVTGRTGNVPALFGTAQLSASDAALLNGVAAHALDYDDVGLESHPSVVLVPALLAARRSGQQGFALVQAYAKGYATWAELHRRLRVGLHARGWHPTPVLGAVAAAAAVGALHGLDEKRLGHALGIAASASGGVVANFGSMTKPLHIGRAAQSGLHAVELAQAGLTASEDALDGHAGLLAALAGPGGAELSGPCPALFEWALLRQRPGIKKYPVCYAAHRSVDGVLALREQHSIVPEDVVSVTAWIGTTTAAVLRQHEPATVTQARFSLEFCVAAALARGSVGLRDVSEEALQDASVRRLMPLVKTIAEAGEACPIEPSFALHDRVQLVLRDGRVLESGPIRFARGHSKLPLSAAEVEAKLFACAPEEASLARGVLADVDRTLSD